MTIEVVEGFERTNALDSGNPRLPSASETTLSTATTHDNSSGSLDLGVTQNAKYAKGNQAGGSGGTDDWGDFDTNDCHWSFYIYISSVSSERTLLTLHGAGYASTGTQLAHLKVTTNREIKLVDFGGTTLYTTSALTQNEWHRVDLQMNHTNGTDWLLEIDGAGSSGTNGSFSGTPRWFEFIGNSSDTVFVDDMLFGDEFISQGNDYVIETLFPNADGHVHDFSGTYANVDNQNVEDSWDSINTSTFGNKHFVSFPNLSQSGDSVPLISCDYYMYSPDIGTSETSQIEQLVYLSGVEKTSGDYQIGAGVNGFGEKFHTFVHKTDPNNNAWTETNVNSTEVGLKHEGGGGDRTFCRLIAMNVIVESATPTVYSLTADSIATGSPSVGSTSITQVHSLDAAAIATGSPSTGTPTASHVHELTADSIATGSSVVGTPDITQLHDLSAVPLDTAAPTVGTPSLSHIHELSADSIATGSPAIGIPNITQLHALGADSIETSAPTVGNPAASHIHELSADSISTGSPVVGTPIISQVHSITATAISTGAPILSEPTASTEGTHDLTAVSVETGAPTLGSPDLSEVYQFTADATETASPVIGLPPITQVHSLSASGVATGSPSTGTPTLDVYSSLAADSIATVAPTTGQPVMTQRHALTASNLFTAAPKMGTPALDGAVGDDVRSSYMRSIFASARAQLLRKRKRDDE